MAKFKLKCTECKEKFTIEVTKENKQKRHCPKCGSENIRADYEQPEISPKFESDGIRCFCPLK